MNTHKGMTMQTKNGNIAHVLADPNMSKETEQAIAKMIDLAFTHEQKILCNICGCEKSTKDCDYCIRQYALSWGL